MLAFMDIILPIFRQQFPRRLPILFYLFFLNKTNKKEKCSSPIPFDLLLQRRRSGAISTIIITTTTSTTTTTTTTTTTAAAAAAAAATTTTTTATTTTPHLGPDRNSSPQQITKLDSIIFVEEIDIHPIFHQL